MKNLLSVALVLFFAVTLSAQVTTPKINFETSSHDFSEIKEVDGPVTFIFKFTNIGTEPLILQNVRASCGCTTPKWTKEPVLPNAEGEIAVTYNPRNRPGSFRKTITVTSNSESKTDYLTIKGKVIARVKTKEEMYPFTLGSLRLKRSHNSLFTMTNKETKSGNVEVYNPTTKDIDVTFPTLPDHITAEPVTIEAGKEGVVVFVYDASKKGDWGFVDDNVNAWIDGAKANTKIKLSATIVEDFSDLTAKERANAPKLTLSTRKVEFGTVAKGDAVVNQVTVTNTGKSNLLIHSVKSTSIIMKCTFDKAEVKPGETATIEISVDTKRTSGRQYKTVNVITNDPTTPNQTITLSGNVK